MTRYRHSVLPPQTVFLTKVENGTTLMNSPIVKPSAEERMCYDTVIDHFKLRSAKGEIFNNPFTKVVTTYKANDTYSCLATGSGGWTKWHHADGAGSTSLWGSMAWPTLTLDTSIADAHARLECIGSVNKTEFDVGTFAGEWSKTKILHRDILSTLWKIVSENTKVIGKRSTFKKVFLYDDHGRPLLGRKGQPLYKYAHDADERDVLLNRRTRNLANLWLQWRMAIVPLLSDLEGACKVISKNRALRQTARAGYSDESHSSVPWSLGDAFGWTWTGVLDTWLTRSVRFGILYESSTAGRMAAQLGISRPLSTAWEFVPWSFIFDWLFEVGNWLDAIQPSFASKTLSAWDSSHETLVKRFTIDQAKSWVDGESHAEASWSGTATGVSVTQVRTPWVPAVPFAPLLGKGLTVMRSGDLAALMLQKIKTRF